jgi:hypothetical protein
MPRIWSVLVIGLVLLSGPSAAFAEWREQVAADRLTGARTVVMANAALNSANQFGRKVSATLVLRCIEGAGRVKHPSAAIVFSERVAMEAVLTKYRIDNGPIRRNKMASVQNDGLALGVGWPELMTRLPTSSVLHVEFNLPWAGHALIEFDTRGASEAFRRIACGSAKPVN